MEDELLGGIFENGTPTSIFDDEPFLSGTQLPEQNPEFPDRIELINLDWWLEPIEGDRRVNVGADDRFQVEVNFSTPDQPNGRAQGVQITEDSVAFWFNDPANIDLVVKVIDGCNVNDRHWVFASGTTDVEHEILIDDFHSDILFDDGFESGDVSAWSSTGAPEIRDTNAFSTCP